MQPDTITRIALVVGAVAKRRENQNDQHMYFILTFRTASAGRRSRNSVDIHTPNGHYRQGVRLLEDDKKDFGGDDDDEAPAPPR